MKAQPEAWAEVPGADGNAQAADDWIITPNKYSPKFSPTQRFYVQVESGSRFRLAKRIQHD